MLGIKTKIKRFIAHCIGASFYSPRKKTLEQLPFNIRIKLYIPTYDNRNQIVHPDILIQNQDPRYVLAFTPYPKTNFFAIIPKFADQKGRLVLCFQKQERQA